MIFRTSLFSLILISFLNVDSFAQVSYNAAVRYSYDSVYRKLDAKLQRLINNPEKNMRGVALLTSFTIDTLNKEDYSASAITPVKTDPGMYTPEKVLVPDIMVARGKAKGDSLFISISPWFAAGEEIKHKIWANNIVSSYELWEREDKGYRVNNPRPGKEFSVNTIAKMVLSEGNPSAGKIVYGSAELTTDDFIQLYAPGFKSNGMRLRYKYSYVFKITTLKDDGL
jgi:hypothetical protein